ncbi:hypothetical protein Hte_011568 [Hypoxylon texense]
MELRNRQISDEAVASNLSWNTFLSRTSVSSLSSAAFSDPSLSGQVHGLDDVLNTVKALSLPRFQYGEVERQDVVGEGETFIVERCVVRNQVLAMKHLKTNLAPDDGTFRRRLQSVILELRIMRHAPLRSHPNILAVFGYGWNMKATQIVPYLLVQYAPYGTLREYLRHFKAEISMVHKEILLGDIAAATSTLHLCGIVHGDIKLDNVLVFHSWDRPNKSIAKIADFGHSLITSGKGDSEQAYIRYGGTFIYNAPEVHNQKSCPIDRAALSKCDVWAFGLLAWETFLDGEEYVKRIAEMEPSAVEDGSEPVLTISDRFLELAKKSLPCSKSNLRGRLIHSVFNMTIQTNPAKRISNLAKLPFMSQWNSAGIQGLEAELALHFGSSEWSYEMCRSENSREIPWEHEVQIYQGLQRTHSSSHNRNGDVAWQLALCQHVGFGDSPNPSSAYQLALAAEKLNHPVAKLFAPLLAPNGPPESYITATSYASRIVDLLQQGNIVDASRSVDQNTLFRWLEREKDGCITLLHLLFAFEGHPQEKEFLELLQMKRQLLPLDEPTITARTAHAQWPLRLVGSPLVFAISVGSVKTVHNLLSLGADPYSRAFAPGQFPEEDQRSKWTPIHVAVQYHCHEILSELLEVTPSAGYEKNEVPYSCALSYSSSLERIAMHGNNRGNSLKETISILNKAQLLSAPAPNGRTALMQAIDFHDADVVIALLEANDSLASTLFQDPQNLNNFNRPIHWAAQLGARRDVPEAVHIIKMINDFSDDMNSNKNHPLDSAWRTPLHLAVTGPSTRTSTWIVEKRPDQMHIEDKFGRTALHYCYSPANVNLLLSNGADVNKPDKYGLTALHGACLRGELDIVRCLLEKKPLLYLRDNSFGTPLHCAILRGSLDVAMALLEAGAPVNCLDKFGDTPLHLAASLSRHNIIRLLLQHGVDPDIVDLKGRTAATIAQNLGTVAGMVSHRILHGEDGSLDAGYAKALYAQYLENGFDTNVIPVYRSRDASSASNSMSHESDVAVGSVELIDYAGSFQAETGQVNFDAEVESLAETQGPERKLAEFVSYLNTEYGIPLVGAREAVRALVYISKDSEGISLTELQQFVKLRDWEKLRDAAFVLRRAWTVAYNLCHVFLVSAWKLLSLEDTFYEQRSDRGQRGAWYEMKDHRIGDRSPWYGLARSIAAIFELGRSIWQVLKLDDARVNELVDVGKMFDLVALDESVYHEGLVLTTPFSIVEDFRGREAQEAIQSGRELPGDLNFDPYSNQRASFGGSGDAEGGAGRSRDEDDGQSGSSDDTDDKNDDTDEGSDEDDAKTDDLNKDPIRGKPSKPKRRQKVLSYFKLKGAANPLSKWTSK